MTQEEIDFLQKKIAQVTEERDEARRGWAEALAHDAGDGLVAEPGDPDNEPINQAERLFGTEEAMRLFGTQPEPSTSEKPWPSDEERWPSGDGGYRVFPWMGRWSWHYTLAKDGYRSREKAITAARNHETKHKSQETTDGTGKKPT